AFLGRRLPQRRLRVRPGEGRRAALRITLEVVLILGTDLPEVTGLADRGHGLAEPVARGVDVADRLLGHPALLLARKEDLGAVDAADEALAQVGSVNLEEVLEQVPVGDSLRIEDDLDRLGVPARVLQARVLALSAHPSDTGGNDSVRVAQQLLHDPVAAAGED